MTDIGTFSLQAGADGAPATCGAWMLAHRPEAAGEARKVTGTLLQDWRVQPETADAVILVVSELVTNAVEHARPPLALHLHRDGAARQVHVEVSDGGPANHEGAWAASCADEERGRGLRIIDFLTTAHGDHQETDRVTHWADLPMAV